MRGRFCFLTLRGHKKTRFLSLSLSLRARARAFAVNTRGGSVFGRACAHLKSSRTLNLEKARLGLHLEKSVVHIFPKRGSELLTVHRAPGGHLRLLYARVWYERVARKDVLSKHESENARLEGRQVQIRGENTYHL